MKRFEDYLTRCLRAEWSNHYMNYTALKNVLKACRIRRLQAMDLLKQRRDGFVSEHEWKCLFAAAHLDYAQLTDETTETLLHCEDALFRLATIERDETSQCLQREWSKAMHFYETEIIQSLRSMVSQSDATEDSATELLEATSFLVVTVITLRQALIRYDGYARTYKTNMPLSEWHWQRSLNAADNNSGDGQNPIIPNVLYWNDLRDIEQILVNRMQSSAKVKQARDLHRQFEHLGNLLDQTENHVQKAASGHIILKDRLLGIARQYVLFGLQSYGLSMEPKLLVLRGQHLKREIQAVDLWRRTRHREGAEASMFDELEPSNVVPLILNLASCFFYMLNNYIIEPSSAYYANALGSSDALSGIIIGGAPLFALVSSVVYSFWTNRSYKAPILFAGILMVIGNLMYANAYSYKSIEVCLIGRAVTGLGAPRVINRRYVADATPFSLRTVASASFAMATALGAALGPAAAIVLDQFEFEFTLPFLGRQYFNGMTGPGYFMSVCWLVYIVAIVIFFEEPVRSGLDELKERENLSTVVNEGRSESVNVSDNGAGTERLMSIGSFDDEESFGKYSAPIPTETKDARCCGCIRHLTRAVVICMALIFMKRIALESIVGSTSVITKNRYAWNITNVGTLHLVNGIIVIPVSIMAGWLSTYYEDRYLAVWCMSITLLGMLLLVDISDMMDHSTSENFNEGHWLAVGPGRYIAGSLIAFSGIEACESYVASLMSKVVPSALAVGTFNSGLLATLVGTVRLRITPVIHFARSNVLRSKCSLALSRRVDELPVIFS